jgi:hypothetical protein
VVPPSAGRTGNALPSAPDRWQSACRVRLSRPLSRAPAGPVSKATWTGQDTASRLRV